MLSLLLAAAEPSKVPVYIIGGLLAVYAVALATFGINRPDFPGGTTAMRGVMALSFVLFLAAIAAAILTDP